MKAKCPRCRFEYGYTEAVVDRDLLEIIRMQADFSPHARLVFEYAELFDATRPVKAKKLLRVLTEIREMYVPGEFVFQKSRYGISRNGIAGSLKVVCGKHFTEPLSNHNYLKKVMISMAEEEAKKRSVEEERKLKEKETGLRTGARPSVRPEPAVGQASRLSNVEGSESEGQRETKQSQDAPTPVGAILAGLAKRREGND